MIIHFAAEEQHLCSLTFLPSTLLLGNILAHPEKRFYNSDTAQSAKPIAQRAREIHGYKQAAITWQVAKGFHSPVAIQIKL
jgi:hypothetical protein